MSWACSAGEQNSKASNTSGKETCGRGQQPWRGGTVGQEGRGWGASELEGGRISVALSWPLAAASSAPPVGQPVSLPVPPHLAQDLGLLLHIRLVVEAHHLRV